MKETLIIVLGILFVVIGMIAIGIALDAMSCSARFASFEHKYGIFSGCLIKVNEKWIPDEAYYVKEDFTK